MVDKRASTRGYITPSKTKLGAGTSLRELRTPSKIDQPGIPRTVFTHGSTLRSLLNDWQRFRSRGTVLCRGILALRLHECEEREYPDRLGPLVENLLGALDGLRNVVESMEIVDKQLQAVALLQPSDEPVVSWWSAGEIARVAHDVCRSYRLEYDLKKYVTENIAHCRNEQTSEVLASAWELEAHVDPIQERYLLTDLGLWTPDT